MTVTKDIAPIIVGAGIGGLAAALFLHEAGIRGRIYEAAAEVREVGVGINIQPHAMKELEKIGLLEEVLQAGTPCERWLLANRFGQDIWAEPRGRSAGHDWPQVSIHRGRLQGILLRAVQDRLGADAITTGTRLRSFTQNEDRVTADLVTREGGRELTEDAGVLIGADGIHSTVRAQLYPAEGEPKYGGQELWRGVTRGKPFLDGSTMLLSGYDEQKFIAYPITRLDEDGTCLINWIAEVRSSTKLHLEDWNREGDVADILERYQSWQWDWLDVPGLIASAEAVYEFPMIDRDPLERWTFGRVTLLGDAAHPMYPIGANGASQAIRDASTLADALATEGVAGFATYEDDRRPVTARIVESNRRLGPEQVMQIAHERAPEGFADISDVISHDELAAISREYMQVTWAGSKR